MSNIKQDAITLSVRRQLAAFTNAGAHRFKVQCVPDAALCGKPRLKGSGVLHPWKPWAWTSDKILKDLNMLKLCNLEGFNIFIAPLPVSEGRYAPLAFVDDILPDALAQMKADGVTPAVLIESSNSKFQGWVRVAADHLTASEIMSIQRTLVNRYGLDAGAIGAEQNGRLAGFRNMKQKYLHEYRFAKLIAANNVSVNRDLISTPEAASEAVETADLTSKPLERSSNSPTSGKLHRTETASNIDQFWMRKIGAKSKPSISEEEFSACLACLRKGFSVEEVEDVLFRLGENLIERKRSEAGAWDYVRRTVGKAALYINGS